MERRQADRVSIKENDEIMLIGGLEKFSLVDYPGKTCAVIFTQGCNYRCRYCHNQQLTDPRYFEKSLPIEEVFDFLRSRIGLLDAVTISGGEPTIQSNLAEFIRRVKVMRFRIKLDTNGSRPEVIRELLNEGLLDYIAMDVKAPFDKYVELCRSAVDTDALKQSIQLIEQSGVSYQFRTTYDKRSLNAADLSAIRALIQKPEELRIQACRY